jgi:hypothetical protein
MGFVEDVLKVVGSDVRVPLVQDDQWGTISVNELAHEATDGRTSQVDTKQAAVFLGRAHRAAEEIDQEMFRDDNYNLDTRIDQEADNCVPTGTYDRWMVFTDLKGWESERYYEATFDSGALNDNNSFLPAYVLFGMAENVIRYSLKLIQSRRSWD